MKTTVYKCDRCGATDSNNVIDIQTIGVHWGQYTLRQAYASDQNNDWCLKCRKEILARASEILDEPAEKINASLLEKIITTIIKKNSGSRMMWKKDVR
jgi:DNA-directed RNA polymerase subunit RPC12/RpoP